MLITAHASGRKDRRKTERTEKRKGQENLRSHRNRATRFLNLEAVAPGKGSSSHQQARKRKRVRKRVRPGSDRGQTGGSSATEKRPEVRPPHAVAMET